MSDSLKKRWIVIGFVWAAVFGLTLLNINNIDSIEKARKKKEIYLMDEQFWSHNASNISQILKNRASLIQEVESSKLGVLEFEKNLRHLTLNLGLNTIKLITQTNSGNDGIVPVKISFQGNFKQAMTWLELLKIELPYAQIRNIRIMVDKPVIRPEFTVSLNYRYRLAAEESSI